MLLNKNFFRQAIAKIQLSIVIDGAFVVGLNTLGARRGQDFKASKASKFQVLSSSFKVSLDNLARPWLDLSVSKQPQEKIKGIAHCLLAC